MSVADQRTLRPGRVASIVASGAQQAPPVSSEPAEQRYRGRLGRDVRLEFRHNLGQVLDRLPGVRHLLFEPPVRAQLPKGERNDDRPQPAWSPTDDRW